MAAALAPIALCTLAFVSGCGDDKSTSSVSASPEAKKADADVQKSMMEYMKTKGAQKKK
jgi:hypothetical protein